ncbi:MAG: ABC transporter substrate-binding protein [Ferrovibrionaceae bacterium]
MVTRRSLLAAGVLAGLPALGRAATRTVTDLAGRRVTLPVKVDRAVLIEAGDIVTLSLLHPDPAALVVGWAATARIDSDRLLDAYRRPDIAVVGDQTGGSVAVERIIALRPDLVVMTDYMDPGAGDGPLTRMLTAAGIPVVFSGVASNDRRPATAMADDTAALLRLFGAIFDCRDRAEAVVAFHEAGLRRVADRVATVQARPKVLLEVQSTFDDCCWVAGRDLWGRFIDLAGGVNLSAVRAPWFENIGIERVIAERPDVYVASGGSFAADRRPALGPGCDAAVARAALQRLAGRQGFALLPAVRDRRVHGIWTGLVTMPPLGLLLVEALARWLHPAVVADIDPAATLDQLNRRFLAKPIEGGCWVSLDPS